MHHCGDHFSSSLPWEDRVELARCLLELITPISHRAAKILQTWIAESKKHEKGVTDEELSRHNRREAEHEPISDRIGSFVRSLNHGRGVGGDDDNGDNNSDRANSSGAGSDEGQRAGPAGDENAVVPDERRSQHVALVMGGRHKSADGDTSGGSPLELTLLAALCLENLASQSLTMVEFLIRHGAVRSLGLQLQPDHWVQHVYASDTQQHDRSRPGDRNEPIVSSAELQRQCIATLSAFALALPGNTELRVELMQCEQPLLFLAQASTSVPGSAHARSPQASFLSH